MPRIRSNGLTINWAILAKLLGACALCLCAGIATARPLDEVKATKYLRVAVYENFPPYSYMDGKNLQGIDVALGRVIAKKLGVEIRFLIREADENVDDDLRNNIWKGHYLGGGVADVMMHVPYHIELDLRNELIKLTGKYYTERMALAVDPGKVGKAETLAIFRYEKIGVELDTIADLYLSSTLQSGRVGSDNIVRYRDFKALSSGLKAGEVSGILAPQAQAEAAAKSAGRPIKVVRPPMPGLSPSQWDVGLAVKTDSRDLGYALNDIISEMRESGEIEKMFAKHGLSYYASFSLPPR